MTGYRLPSNSFHLSLSNARSADTFLTNILISFSTASLFHLVRSLLIGLFLCMVSVKYFSYDILICSPLMPKPFKPLNFYIRFIILDFPYSLYRSIKTISQTYQFTTCEHIQIYLLTDLYTWKPQLESIVIPDDYVCIAVKNDITKRVL